MGTIVEFPADNSQQQYDAAYSLYNGQTTTMMVTKMMTVIMMTTTVTMMTIMTMMTMMTMTIDDDDGDEKLCRPISRSHYWTKVIYYHLCEVNYADH